MSIFSALLFRCKIAGVKGLATGSAYKGLIGSHEIAGRFCSPSTSIVIEGFPRCANSYAFNYFRELNPKISEVARHIHTPSQIAIASKYDVPTILLIREPLACAASLSELYGARALNILLSAYISYHESVVRFAERSVVIDFDATKANFGRAIQSVNERFGTAFNSEGCSATDANVKEYLQNFGKSGLGVSALPPLREQDSRSTCADKNQVSRDGLDRARDIYGRLRNLAICSKS